MKMQMRIKIWLSRKDHERYRASLANYLGYCGIDGIATLFDEPCPVVLGRMLCESPELDDFLQRYRVDQRARQRQRVKVAIAFWLAEMIGGEQL